MLVVQTKKIGASATFLATLGSDSSVESIKSYRTQDSAECKELATQTSQLKPQSSSNQVLEIAQEALKPRKILLQFWRSEF
jgi:hypothetical protein